MCMKVVTVRENVIANAHYSVTNKLTALMMAAGI